MERFDNLLVTLGLEIEDAGALGQWDKLENRLSVLADEMRFRIFEDREDAVHATVNAVSTVLEKAGYRCTCEWSKYEAEFVAHLRSPHTDQMKLKKCIRTHFERPTVRPT